MRIILIEPPDSFLIVESSKYPYTKKKRQVDIDNLSTSSFSEEGTCNDIVNVNPERKLQLQSPFPTCLTVLQTDELK